MDSEPYPPRIPDYDLYAVEENGIFTKERQMKIVILILALFLPAIAPAEELVFDQNWQLKYRIEEGRIYDKSWQLKGHLQDAKTYDNSWQWKGWTEDGRLYDKIYEPSYNLKSHIEGDGLYSPSWTPKGYIKKTLPGGIRK